MRSLSLRLKIIMLVIGLVIGSGLTASALHGHFAFSALKSEVRNRAASVASEIAFGVTTNDELRNRDLLLIQLRNILAARPTLRWLEVYAEGPSGLHLVASSRAGTPSPPALTGRAFDEGLTVTAAGTGANEGAWIAAAPITIDGQTAGVVALALSLEGAERLALSLRQQLLFLLVAAGLTIVTGLALYTERSVNRPIRALLSAMADVERGNLAAVPAVARRDEMGRLADGLSAMLRRIRESAEENAALLARINLFNVELQGRVTEATRELADRNEALHRANELLFDLQRQLGRAQRLATLGQLAATIAHEIGTPLNSISVHLQLLARSGGLTEQDRQRLVIIDGQIQRLVQTVQRLLAATRGEAARPEPTELNPLVRGIAELMAPVLAAKNIRCTAAVDESLPRVWIDGNQMQQVILNLLTNALDAMPGGGRLHLETAQVGESAILRVADSGSGVPPEIREQIFEPFFTTKAHGAGVGLGLAICRQILQAHRGTIEVAEAPGGGTLFEIRLPLEPGERRA
jgi:signal transduction histidine kinase